MKRLPKWMKKQVSAFISHPRQTIKEVAKVILRDAQESHAEGHKEASKIGRKIAAALESVANGATWQDAFGLHDEQEPDQ